VYTGLAMLAYALACILTFTVALNIGSDLKTLVMRLIIIATMGFLGNYYFRIQRIRLAKATKGDTSSPLRPSPRAARA
jgi:hypothetical protein